MASGRRHARKTRNAVVLVLGGAILIFVPLVISSFVAGLIVGHYATPDVRDQSHVRNHPEHLVDKHFGKVAGRLWTALWWLPAYIIPHRSPFSHLPLFATTIAAAWLYGVPLALLWWYQPQWFGVTLALLPWHVAGWTVQDVIHLAQDGWRIRW